MSLNLPYGIRPLNPMSNIDEDRYGPHSTRQEALNATAGTRALGLTVGIIEEGKVVDYWFEEGILDNHLVKKTITVQARNATHIDEEGQVNLGGEIIKDTEIIIPGEKPYFKDGPKFDGETVINLIELPNGNYILLGPKTYKGTVINGIVGLNPDFTINEEMDFGSGFGENVYPVAALLQDSGKIVIQTQASGGVSRTYRGATIRSIFRINQDGTIDSTFTLSGVTDVVPSMSGPPRLEDAGSNKVLATVQNPGRLVRLNSNGSLDSSFSIITLDNLSDYRVQKSTGSIFVKISNQIRKYSPNGVLDTSFTFRENDGGWNIFAVFDNGEIVFSGAYSEYDPNPYRVYDGVEWGTNEVVFLNTDGSFKRKVPVYDNYNSEDYHERLVIRGGDLYIISKWVYMSFFVLNYVYLLEEGGSAPSRSSSFLSREMDGYQSALVDRLYVKNNGLLFAGIFDYNGYMDIVKTDFNLNAIVNYQYNKYVAVFNPEVGIGWKEKYHNTYGPRTWVDKEYADKAGFAGYYSTKLELDMAGVGSANKFALTGTGNTFTVWHWDLAGNNWVANSTGLHSDDFYTVTVDGKKIIRIKRDGLIRTSSTNNYSPTISGTDPFLTMEEDFNWLGTFITGFKVIKIKVWGFVTTGGGSVLTFQLHSGNSTGTAGVGVSSDTQTVFLLEIDIHIRSNTQSRAFLKLTNGKATTAESSEQAINMSDFDRAFNTDIPINIQGSFNVSNAANQCLIRSYEVTIH